MNPRFLDSLCANHKKIEAPNIQISQIPSTLVNIIADITLNMVIVHGISIEEDHVHQFHKSIQEDDDGIYTKIRIKSLYFSCSIDTLVDWANNSARAIEVLNCTLPNGKSIYTGTQV